MKKLILSTLCLIASISAFSQVKVLHQGQLQLGNEYAPSKQSSLEVIVPNPTAKVQTDTLSQLCIIGRSLYGSGGYITFGNGRNVTIGEMDGSDSDVLELTSAKGILYECNGQEIFGMKRFGNFMFRREVNAPAFNVTSDIRLKKDVAEIDAGTASRIYSLIPISYRLANDSRINGDMPEESASESVKSMAAADNTLRYGFSAQEVRKFFPEIVKTDEDGYLSIDYIALIPLMIEQLGELHGLVEKQGEVIAMLTNAPKRKADVLTTLSSDQVSLSQNRPNPFRNETIIECYLPESVGSAEMFVFDLQGQQVLRKVISGRGNTGVSVDGSTLRPGMYIYSLIVDGVEFDSKRMILTE